MAAMDEPVSRTTTRDQPRSAIETRSIDYVPENERHGRVWMQGPFWFLGNFQPFTVAIGFVGPLVGLTLGWTIVAAVLGILFGTLFMAAHASQGPKLGLPQMIQCRAQFGYRGVILPLIATGFTYLAFNVVDTIIIKEGLKGIFGWNATLVAVLITLLGAALAIYGHDWLHRVFQVLFWVSIPFWLVLTIGVISGHAGGQPAPAAGFTWAGFLAMFTVAASYNITYAPYVSDYSRYLPRQTPTGTIIASVFWGAAGSPIWLIPLGAWMATRLGVTDALVGIHDAGNNVVGSLGSILAILAVLALVATMGLNAYSGMLTIVTAVDAFRPVNPTRQLRVVTIVVLAVIWLVGGLALTGAVSSLNNALLAMLYLLAPWTAINLLDFFLLRHGHYAITDLFTPNGIYGTWNRFGVTAYLVAIVVEIPFAYIPGFYESKGASWLQGVDISWILGMIVGGGLYALLARGADLAAERPAIERSERALAETGVAR
jgi:nucleobase:cation symporter-1, NCS1 family